MIPSMAFYVYVSLNPPLTWVDTIVIILLS